ncbi:MULTISPECIES: nuclear transport factor 2 family protein [Halomonadaceae]|uniref:nuclear transport factor 2 family protein n=1 Tax=Halomonadaceae TaxID=28256 RepID=UPI001597366D|nr:MULTISPECIES: nuclear transport factor 2 family protein [Halomonas]QJQ95128.1 nuclear transport factor 2 family protein [Halomonas sp. PA5]
MDDEKHKQILIEKYLSAYNSFDIDRMLATLHDEIEFRNVSGGVINAHASGKEQFRRLAEHGKTLFLSRQLTVRGYDLEAEPATVNIHFRGSLAFDIPEGASKGETMEMEGRSEFSFQDGLIRKIVDIS